MDRSIQVVGFVLRAPFFAVWILWLALLTVVDAAVTGLWFFVVLPILFCLVKVPLKFVAVAFRNHGSEHLHEELSQDTANWKAELSRFPERVTARWPDAWTWYVTAGQ